MQVFAVLTLLLASMTAQADDIAAACQEPGWDMSREILAFRDLGMAMEAGS